MADNQELLSQLKKILHWKKSIKEYSKILSCTEEDIRSVLFEIRKKDYPNFSKKVDIEKGVVESVVICDYEPKDYKELAKLHKIDLKFYNIKNYWSKLLPNGKFTSSVFATKKTKEDFNETDLIKLLQNYKSNYTPVRKEPNDPQKELVDLEISISDYHLAKKHVDDDNDPEARVRRYYNIAQSLVEKAHKIYNIDTIVFPISNDFFHTDNYQHSTTNGTPQETIVDYAQEYELGFDLLASVIRMFTIYANNVNVVLVQGNHDRTKSYYLAHGLSVYFKDDFRIVFDRENSLVKGVTLGETFIGYHHGNCKIDELPLLFATHSSFSNDFGKSTYREVHTGDKHHYMAKEVKGVRIQQMPSLSGTDRWHLDNNFVHSVRAAIALIYDKKKGKICELEERI